MTGHFLNSCALYTKVFVLHFFFSSKGKGKKEQKVSWVGYYLTQASPFPTSCFLQAAPYPTGICKVSCSYAQVRLPGVEQLLDVLVRGYAEPRLPSPVSEGTVSSFFSPLQILAPLGVAF